MSMNIIISIHNVWANKIFSGEKTLEFRNSLPKNLNPGDKIFIYETYRNLGKKMVVGYFTLKNAYKIPKCGRCGYTSFIEYWAKEIKKDEELYKLINKCANIVMDHHYQDIVYSYMYCSEVLDYMEKNHDMPELGIKEYMDKTFIKNKKNSEKIISECDSWLENIGYYNDCCESHYSYVFEVSSPVQFKTPVPITEFLNAQNEPIKKAPQSWCYTTTK